MKTQTKVITLVLIMVLCLFGCGKAAKWQKQYDLGVRYLAEGDYEQAILSFTQAIEIDPKSADAYIQLADVYVAMGDLESATEVLSLGLENVEVKDLLQARLEEIENLIEEEQRNSLYLKFCQDLDTFFAMSVEEAAEYFSIALASNYPYSEEAWEDYMIGDQPFIQEGYTYHNSSDENIGFEIDTLGEDNLLSDVSVWNSQREQTNASDTGKQFSGWEGIYLGDTYDEVLEALGISGDISEKSRRVRFAMNTYDGQVEDWEVECGDLDVDGEICSIHVQVIDYGMETVMFSNKYEIEFTFSDGEYLSGVQYHSYARFMEEYMKALERGPVDNILDEELPPYEGVFTDLPDVFKVTPRQVLDNMGLTPENERGQNIVREGSYWFYEPEAGNREVKYEWETKTYTGYQDYAEPGYRVVASVETPRNSNRIYKAYLSINWDGEGGALPDDIPLVSAGWEGLYLGAEYRDVRDFLGLSVPEGISWVILRIDENNQRSVHWPETSDGSPAPTINIFMGTEGDPDREYYAIRLSFEDGIHLTNVEYENSALLLQETLPGRE